MTAGTWLDLAPGVLARRYAELDLTVGLVLGRDRALVIDTRGDVEQGAELAAAVRELTSLPVTVVLTHGHFDHCFGTEAFGDCPVLAHPRCHAYLERTAAAQRDEWIAHYRGTPTAAALARTVPVLPTPAPAELDLGARTVRLLPAGPAHTDHDLVIDVPGAGVVFAGDLIESGAPPDHSDSRPLTWADAVATLPVASIYVAGHGDPMTPVQVAAQQAELAEVAALARAVAAGGLTPAEADERSPHPGVPWLAGQ